jgi:hypothetical protein
VGKHEDRGWHEMHAVEMRGYTETMVAMTLGEGEAIEIDPTRAQIWRIEVTGTTGTISVSTEAFPTPTNPRKDAPERMRTWSCVLLVSVAAGAVFPSVVGVKWSEGRTEPDVTMPDGSVPDEDGWPGRYYFTFLHDPVAGDVLGFEGGARF